MIKVIKEFLFGREAKIGQLYVTDKKKTILFSFYHGFGKEDIYFLKSNGSFEDRLIFNHIKVSWNKEENKFLVDGNEVNF